MTPSHKNTIHQMADTNFNMLIYNIMRKLVSWPRRGGVLGSAIEKLKAGSSFQKDLIEQ